MHVIPCYIVKITLARSGSFMTGSISRPPSTPPPRLKTAASYESKSRFGGKEGDKRTGLSTHFETDLMGPLNTSCNEQSLLHPVLQSAIESLGIRYVCISSYFLLGPYAYVILCYYYDVFFL